MGAVHISELQNGVKEGDVTLRTGDGVGSGDASAQGLDVGFGHASTPHQFFLKKI